MYHDPNLPHHGKSRIISPISRVYLWVIYIPKNLKIELPINTMVVHPSLSQFMKFSHLLGYWEEGSLIIFPMVFYGSLWFPMVPYGFLWFPMVPMVSYGSYSFLWFPMVA